MRFGVITLPNVPWSELVERWRRLDELGVETIWVADHLANPMQPEQLWLEGWTCLAGMASVTERARIGPLVSPATFRNPAVLAKAAVTVDHVSEGRLELGIGAGGAELDLSLARVERVRPGRLRELVLELRRLLDDVSLAPRPVQERIPLTIGGQAPSTLRLAAEVADRWNTYLGRGLRLAEAARLGRELNDRLDELCAETGRTVVRSALIGYRFVAETPWRSDAAFRELVERWAGAGFEELIVYYPPGLAMPEGSVAPGVFERALSRG